MKLRILVLIALLLRVMSEINNPLLTSDHAIQLEAAKNFITDGTFTNSHVDASDLSIVKHKPLTMWPVGLSLTVYLLNFITNNLIYAEILFQCIGAILLVLGLFKLLKFFKVESKILDLFLILIAFNPAPFLYLGSTDLFTAGLFTWIVYYTIIEFNSENRSFKNLLLISLLSFFAAALRFACIPNLAIIPLVFFIMSFIKDRNKNIVNAMIVLLLSIIPVILFYKLFPFSSGRTSFVENVKNGTFYFSHLKWFDPFTIKGFFYTRPIEFRLPSSPIVLFIYRLTLLLGSIVFIGVIFSVFIKKLNPITWFKKIRVHKMSSQDSFMLILISTLLIVVSFIGLQSLTVPAESNSFGPGWMPHFWTHVYSTRYFIYPIILIIAAFFIAYNKMLIEKKRIVVFFKIVYIVSISWSMLIWIFTQYQFYSPNGNGAGSQWKNEAESIEVFNTINAVQNVNLGKQIVYAHYEFKIHEGLVTNYARACSTDDYSDIVSNNFFHSSKLILLISMPNNLSNVEKQFLANHKHTVLKEFKRDKLIQINLL